MLASMLVKIRWEYYVGSPLAAILVNFETEPKIPNTILGMMCTVRIYIDLSIWGLLVLKYALDMLCLTIISQ